MQSGDVVGVTDVRALSDCIHKVILAEVSQHFGRTRDHLIGWLKQHRESLADLPKTAQTCARLLQLRLSVVPTESANLPTAVAIAQKHQLLLNDAGIVAQMRRHGVAHLITNDDDFDRVPGITVWKPRA